MGRASAILFASEGASIGVADINLESAEGTANEISRAGGRALALQVDVSNESSVQSMVRQTVENFGIPDVLFNNAGTAGKVDFLASMPEEVFDRVLAVNLRGVYLGMKYTLPFMAKLGGASVINQSSAAGSVGIRGSAAYCASKAGVIALTKVAALEYARYKIRNRVTDSIGDSAEWVRRYEFVGSLGSTTSVRARHIAPGVGALAA